MSTIIGCILGLIIGVNVSIIVVAVVSIWRERRDIARCVAQTRPISAAERFETEHVIAEALRIIAIAEREETEGIYHNKDGQS